MLFFKIFGMSIFCFSVVIAHQAHKHNHLKELTVQAMALSAITGAASGVFDVFTVKHTGLPLGFVSEGNVRRMLIQDVLFTNEFGEEKDDKRSSSQKQIVMWFGSATS
jgi:hypothetical protein